ncbi:NTF2-related export protein 1 [Holothuria leucospilota]|uniref:NTF2-related export protein n=1 Tax=Holothuria leucospilota TaxID=206669 RepID=A0A9Q1BL84_HOLLE|nr:NTF2-related export protein 1 [Holothuria leucospilota]
MATEAALKNDQACSAGEEFQKLYYESFDKKSRSLLDKLYMDTARMVWNGNVLEGSKKIIEFLENLPVSVHTIDLLDCHPILESVTNGQTSIMVVVGGKVKFEGNREFPFNENFILTSQQGKWKIISNTFRYFE